MSQSPDDPDQLVRVQFDLRGGMSWTYTTTSAHATRQSHAIRTNPTHLVDEADPTGWRIFIPASAIDIITIAAPDQPEPAHRAPAAELPADEKSQTPVLLMLELTSNTQQSLVIPYALALHHARHLSDPASFIGLPPDDTDPTAYRIIRSTAVELAIIQPHP